MTIGKGIAIAGVAAAAAYASVGLNAALIWFPVAIVLAIIAAA